MFRECLLIWARPPAHLSARVMVLRGRHALPRNTITLLVLLVSFGGATRGGTRFGMRAMRCMGQEITFFGETINNIMISDYFLFVSKPCLFRSGPEGWSF